MAAAADPWWERAACRNADPDIFYPHGTTDRAAITMATMICGGCGVRAECLADADRFGIRAGLTEWDREAVARRRRRRKAEVRRAVPEQAADIAKLLELRRTRGELISAEQTAVLARRVRETGLTPRRLAELGPDIPLDASSYRDLISGKRKQVFSGTAAHLVELLRRAAAARAEVAS